MSKNLIHAFVLKSKLHKGIHTSCALGAVNGLWLALSWLCRVGVSECELGFTAIDVSSGSLGRIHGEGRRE